MEALTMAAEGSMLRIGTTIGARPCGPAAPRSCHMTSSFSSSARPLRMLHQRSQGLAHSVRPRIVPQAVAEDAAGSANKETPPAVVARKSIVCEGCEGNGAVVCSQCQGDGLNTEDHFGGRFKAGMTCWLCRGKRQMLCGKCNGAGFVGGFMSGSED